jgi:hypothetical protein
MSETKIMTPAQARLMCIEETIRTINDALSVGLCGVSVPAYNEPSVVEFLKTLVRRMKDAGWMQARVVKNHPKDFRCGRFLAWDEPSPNEINVLEQGNKGV